MHTHKKNPIKNLSQKVQRINKCLSNSNNKKYKTEANQNDKLKDCQDACVFQDDGFTWKAAGLNAGHWSARKGTNTV